jgi:hypothetical protein
MQNTAQTQNDQLFALIALMAMSKSDIEALGGTALARELELNYRALTEAVKTGALPANIPDTIRQHLQAGPAGPTGGNGPVVRLPGMTGPRGVTGAAAANVNALGVIAPPDELAIPEDLSIPGFMQRAPKSPDDGRTGADGTDRTGADGTDRTGADGDQAGADSHNPANDDLDLPFMQPTGGHAPIPDDIAPQIEQAKLNGGNERARTNNVGRADNVGDEQQAPGLEKNLANFLSRVVPWPQPDMLGYVNVHWRRTDRKGITGGKAFTKLTDALSFIEWAKTRDFIQDLYFCLSLQEKSEPKQNGKLKAVRSAENAVALKAIWLDIDKYPTKADGLKVLKEFCEATRTPYPTAINDSGNGLHAYWISDKPLSVEEWRRYAEGLDALATRHGLLHDAITTDAARVLRVPGTSNRKQDPPKPVVTKLLEADLSFASALGHLLEVKAAPAQGKANPPTQIPDGGPSKVFRESGEPFESLKDGIDPPPPLSFQPIQEGCPFFSDAYETHGKDHAQPLWHLAILATTFLENGEQLAHELGNAHPGYTPETTQEMWDRKMGDRKRLGLGWPSCKAIEDAGCTSCKGCEHHGKIKSPLHLAITSKDGPVVGANHGESRDPVIAEMNRRYSAGTISDKFRIARFDPHPDYPFQWDIQFLSKDDFLNSAMNPRVQARKFDKDGEPDGTKRVPRGQYWFGSSERNEYDAVTFVPNAPAIIRVEYDGRIHQTAAHPIIIEYNDRRYVAIEVLEPACVAAVVDQILKAKKRKAYFAAIREQMRNGGSAALLGFLLKRDISNFEAEAIPETAERLRQKLLSAPAEDQVLIGFAHDGRLPGALYKRPWIARANRDLDRPISQPFALFDVMRERGGQKLSRLSDHKLADILKTWGFKPKSLGDSRGWEAPALPKLREAIQAKYPAVKFEDDAPTEWVCSRNDEDELELEPKTTKQITAEVAGEEKQSWA